jgi:hypothetical protein
MASMTSHRCSRRPKAFRGVSRGALPLVAVGAVSAIGALVGPVSAQDANEPLRPPQPTQEPKAPAILTLFTVLVLTAGVVGATLMPSKRGHQD